jgi:hypothetical protein
MNISYQHHEDQQVYTVQADGEPIAWVRYGPHGSNHGPRTRAQAFEIVEEIFNTISNYSKIIARATVADIDRSGMIKEMMAARP